ncbi:MAG: MBOAT family protein, partial [Clostridia bacterium]|nr:MBOAT family protein [Clostridia bacterium]
GAEWNFIIWGHYFAVLLLVEKFFLLPYLKKCRVVSHVYVLFFVAISFVIFSGNNLTEALSYVGGMFGVGGSPLVSAEVLYYFRSYSVILLVAIVGATPLPKKILARLGQNKVCEKVINLLEIPVLLGILLLATAYLADGSFNPFLYFRF